MLIKIVFSFYNKKTSISYKTKIFTDHKQVLPDEKKTLKYNM